jgi:hypothetical protein
MPNIEVKNDTTMVCHFCGKRFPNETLRSYLCFTCCLDCAEHRGYFTCDKCGILELKSHLLELDDECFCSACASDYGYSRCVSCGTYNVAAEVENGYCKDCLDKYFVHCDSCDDLIHKDDAEINNGVFCPECGDCEYLSKVCIESDTFDVIKSRRFYGLELETAGCDYTSLLRANKAWGSKYDGSIVGKEFVTSKINGDAGARAVSNLYEVAINNRWTVDTRCGYHLHLDMTNESVDGLKAITGAYAHTAGVWRRFVASSRVNNEWCRDNSFGDFESIATNHGWRTYCDTRGSRYQWLNWRAYLSHKTVEVRIHEGTLDYMAIVNWVKAHTSFVDWAARVGLEAVKKSFFNKTTQEQFDALCNIWVEDGYTDLPDYYAKKSVIFTYAPKEAICEA